MVISTGEGNVMAYVQDCQLWVGKHMKIWGVELGKSRVGEEEEPI